MWPIWNKWVLVCSHRKLVLGNSVTVSYDFWLCRLSPCSPDLGEEDERQYKDEDLPGTAAEGGVCHPSTVGCVKHYPTPPRPTPICSNYQSIHPPARLATIRCMPVEFDVWPLIFHHALPLKQSSVAKNISVDHICFVCLFFFPPHKPNASTVVMVIYTADWCSIFCNCVACVWEGGSQP